MCSLNAKDPEAHRLASAIAQETGETLTQIVRVLKPGGVAILSDYKHTSEYAEQLRDAGLLVERRWGNPLYTFPPLRIVVARKV